MADIRQSALEPGSGQASASQDALRRGRETSINPVVFEAAALVIAAANGASSNEVPGHHPDVFEGAQEKGRVTARWTSSAPARQRAAPTSMRRTTLSPAWQRSFWGANYPRLLQIK